jgi:hypothetical protein
MLAIDHEWYAERQDIPQAQRDNWNIETHYGIERMLDPCNPMDFLMDGMSRQWLAMLCRTNSDNL